MTRAKEGPARRNVKHRRPASETWLFKNPRALAMVHQGLKEAKRGRLIRSKKDFSKYVTRNDSGWKRAIPKIHVKGGGLSRTVAELRDGEMKLNDVWGSEP